MKHANEAARRVRVLVMILALWVSAAGPVAAQQPPSGAAKEGFVPIDQLNQQMEQLPAAPLVMAAYAVAWLGIFGYVWSIWQRLVKVEREIADVSRRVGSRGRP
jgi:CcmD family protein